MWLSVHLFYQNIHQLLTQALFPFIHEMKKEKMLDQYFFIRYSEGGKHIRLRVKTNHPNAFKAAMTTHFSLFFQQYPSHRDEERANFYPNNSIQYIPYLPEISRYGGQENTKIAEQQFQLSSEIIQIIIENDEAWNYETALGVAIQLHLIFMRAVRFEKGEVVSFYHEYFKKWSVIVPETYHPTEQQLANQIPVIEFINSFWQDLETINKFEEESLQRWFQGNQTLIQHADFRPFYDSYLHMTNNRLGIYNADELLIARLIEKALQ